MPARKNDPTQRALAVRMHQGGLGYHAIAQMLGISHTTVRWYIRQEGLEPTAYRVEMQEPASEEQPTCWVCHGRSQTWDGHPSCRGKRAA